MYAEDLEECNRKLFTKKCECAMSCALLHSCAVKAACCSPVGPADIAAIYQATAFIGVRASTQTVISSLGA